MPEYELQHHGVKGMKWGVRNKPDYVKRTVRGHGGPGQYTTKKRQLAGDKRDLEGLNKGQHLSVGATKKRQAALDARDKAMLEKRIAKQERSAKLPGKSIGIEKDSYKAYTKAALGGILSGVALDVAVRRKSYKSGKDAVRKIATTAFMTTTVSLLATGAKRSNAEMKKKYG